MTQIQVAQRQVARCAYRYQSALDERQIAVTLGYPGVVLDAADRRVEAARAALDAAWGVLQAARAADPQAAAEDAAWEEVEAQS
jgi:hypothetical protein